MQRYFVGNFSDPEKFQSIKTLMGEHLEQVPFGIRKQLGDCMRERLAEFMTTS